MSFGKQKKGFQRTVRKEKQKRAKKNVHRVRGGGDPNKRREIGDLPVHTLSGRSDESPEGGWI